MNVVRPTNLPPRIDIALLLVRIPCGLAFVYHGCAILFGAFAGPGADQFASAHHMPAAIGYLVGLAQFAGGLAVLAGVLTRIGSASIVIVMLGAIFLVHLPHGFDVAQGGAEYALTQLLIATALLVAGPGAYSGASRLPEPLRKL
jgi:putative oxidoreductase